MAQHQGAGGGHGPRGLRVGTCVAALSILDGRRRQVAAHEVAGDVHLHRRNVMTFGAPNYGGVLTGQREVAARVQRQTARNDKWQSAPRHAHMGSTNGDHDVHGRFIGYA